MLNQFQAFIPSPGLNWPTNTINKMEKTSIQWTETDPDCNQWGRKIRDGVYEFKQDIKIHPSKEKYTTITKQINLTDYSSDTADKMVKIYGFYNYLSATLDIGTAETDWLIAETLFELNLPATF